jgi:hypothetical protein
MMLKLSKKIYRFILIENINMKGSFQKKENALKKLVKLEDHTLHLFGYDLIAKAGAKRYELWSYKKLYKYIISEKDPNYYEFFEADYKVKLFVDIDCEFEKHPECVDYTIDVLIEKTLKIFIQIVSTYNFSNNNI